MDKYSDYIWGVVLLFSVLGSATAAVRHFIKRDERRLNILHRERLVAAIAQVRRSKPSKSPTRCSARPTTSCARRSTATLRRRDRRVRYRGLQPGARPVPPRGRRPPRRARHARHHSAHEGGRVTLGFWRPFAMPIPRDGLIRDHSATRDAPIQAMVQSTEFRSSNFPPRLPCPFASLDRVSSPPMPRSKLTRSKASLGTASARSPSSWTCSVSRRARWKRSGISRPSTTSWRS